jgi:riboflavin synthase
MFTGIIEEVGIVREADAGTLIVDCELIREDTKLGDSIAVNGVDLTVAVIDSAGFFFNVMPETYRRSNLQNLKVGEAVNLERSVRPSDRLSGHMVRGVVEARGRLISFTPEADALLARYEAPSEILRYVVMKGPITVDGVSLTVMAKDDHSFTVSLVQYTQQHTNLTRRLRNDEVNLESDIIARYVDQLLTERLGAASEP